VEEGCGCGLGREELCLWWASGNETTEVRKRKSEEMKAKANGEGKQPLDKRWFKSLN
jgi:hypothetical protein